MICTECGAAIKSDVRKAFEAVIKNSPDKSIELYETRDGQDVFPVYGCSGGISAKQVFYLIRKFPGSKNIETLPCWASNCDLAAQMAYQFDHFYQLMKTINTETDDMGLPGK